MSRHNGALVRAMESDSQYVWLYGHNGVFRDPLSGIEIENTPFSADRMRGSTRIRG
jgi:hypothetical protein